jgi:hypothetical protein
MGTFCRIEAAKNDKTPKSSSANSLIIKMYKFRDSKRTI